MVIPFVTFPYAATFAFPILLEQDSQLMLSLSKEAFLETCIHRQRHGHLCGVQIIVTQLLKDEASGGTWWTGTISTNLAIYTFHNNILHLDAWWTVKLFSTNTSSSLF